MRLEYIRPGDVAVVELGAHQLRVTYHKKQGLKICLGFESIDTLRITRVSGKPPTTREAARKQKRQREARLGRRDLGRSLKRRVRPGDQFETGS